MYYEVMKKKLSLVTSGKLKAKCIICGCNVYMSDYFIMCKEHGDRYYALPKIIRILFPKIIIKILIQG